MPASAIEMAIGNALGILMAALLGVGGAVGVFSVSNGGTGGPMSGNQMAQCGAMNAECGPDHAACVDVMRDGTHTQCAAMGMDVEQCLTMHDAMSGDMMTGSCH